jgi:hypothetical protein
MDKAVELAASGHVAQAVLLALVILVGGLGKRAINGVDEKIKDNKNDVKTLREDTEAEFKEVRDALKSLTDAFSASAIQTKEDMGKIMSEVSFIRGFLVGDSDKEKKSLRNRRSTD